MPVSSWNRRRTVSTVRGPTSLSRFVGTQLAVVAVVSKASVPHRRSGGLRRCLAQLPSRPGLLSPVEIWCACTSAAVSSAYGYDLRLECLQWQAFSALCGSPLPRILPRGRATPAILRCNPRGRADARRFRLGSFGKTCWRSALPKKVKAQDTHVRVGGTTVPRDGHLQVPSCGTPAWHRMTAIGASTYRGMRLAGRPWLLSSPRRANDRPRRFARAGAVLGRERGHDRLSWLIVAVHYCQ